MRLYTKTGDKGKTRLIGGAADKDDIRVEALGTVDELNCFVGRVSAELHEEESFVDIVQDLEKIQHELFDCAHDLANVSPKREMKLLEETISFLENKIDQYILQAPKVEKFILPGGAKQAASIHICRTITRRAERLVVSLIKEEASTPTVVLRYLNRLSDYFFALARVVNARMNIEDIEYVRSEIVFRGGK